VCNEIGRDLSDQHYQAHDQGETYREAGIAQFFFVSLFRDVHSG
jgi:hypothetical protein